jgi:F0F1-type ATP synthase assembly protein I
MPADHRFQTFYAFSLAWQLGFLIALPIGGFTFMGYLADQYLQTQPFLLIMGAFLGVIITAYEVYHLLTPFIVTQNHHPQS